MANQLSWLRGVYFAKGKGEKFEIIWERGDGFKGVIYCIPSPKGEKIYLESWPGVFRQVNPFVNNLLIKMAIDWINEGPTESILDLYSGMGNLTIPFSYLTKNITGVEVNPLSVENARINMKRLNLENIELIRASTKKALKNFVEEKRKFDLIILDPPRGGAIDILEGIILLNPERIIYISCDQATLARDLRYLQESGQYKVNRIYPFDMFPQTFHIESITLLKKID
jgi:23S rRNA (uracil1939-C5)-methyltransferase